MKQKKLGFTLIELMITMVIIGFLAVLTLSLMPRYVQRAQDSVRLGVVDEISTIIKLARTTKNINRFDLTFFHEFQDESGRKIKFNKLLSETSDYKVPEEKDLNFDYVYLFRGKEEFVVLNCSKQKRGEKLFIDGINRFVKDVSLNVKKICPKDGRMSRNIDDYEDNILGFIITGGILRDLD